MASYSLFIKPSAAKEIEAAGARRDRDRLVMRIRVLGKEPRPHGSEKLSGSSELYRVRVGSFRIVYSISDDPAEVHVVKVAHRKDVYR